MCLVVVRTLADHHVLFHSQSKSAAAEVEKVRAEFKATSTKLRQATMEKGINTHHR